MKNGNNFERFRDSNANYLLSQQRFENLKPVWPCASQFYCSRELGLDGWHDLANGDMGICYYLLNTYKTTKDARYLEAVRRALIHIEINAPLNHTPYPGLFHGFGALSALWLTVFSLTRDQYALNQARTLVLRDYVGNTSPENDADIRTGTAGLLFIGAQVLRHEWNAKLHAVLLKNLTRLFSSTFISGGRIYWYAGDHSALIGTFGHFGLEFSIYEAASACHENILAAIVKQQFLLRFRSDLKNKILSAETTVIDALFLERLHELTGTRKKELCNLASPKGLLAQQSEALLESNLPLLCESLRLRRKYGLFTPRYGNVDLAALRKQIARSKNSGSLSLFSGMAGYALLHDYLAGMIEPSVSIFQTFNTTERSNLRGGIHKAVLLQILTNTYPLSLPHLRLNQIRQLTNATSRSLQSKKTSKTSLQPLERNRLRFHKIETKIAQLRKAGDMLSHIKKRELHGQLDNNRQLFAKYFVDPVCKLNPSAVLGDVAENGTLPICIVGTAQRMIFLQPLPALIVRCLGQKSIRFRSLIMRVLNHMAPNRTSSFSHTFELIAQQILQLSSASIVFLSRAKSGNTLLKTAQLPCATVATTISVKPSMAVVIPAYNESNLARTIDSLAKCVPPSGHVLVIVVINSSSGSPVSAIAQNRATFDEMQAMRTTLPTWMTLVTVNHEGLPEWNSGVGVARRIGMQIAVHHLEDDPRQVIASLDADTICANSYLSCIETYFERNRDVAAASIYFEFNTALTTDKLLSRAALEYELQMKYLRMLLIPAGMCRRIHNSGFQLAFRVSAYRQVGGMPLLQGNEDYVFASRLQTASKYGYIQNTTVFPEARLSTRCCIGDGSILFGLMQRTHIAKFWVPKPSLVLELMHFRDRVQRLRRISRSALISTLPPVVAKFIAGRGASLWKELSVLPHYHPSAACDLVATLLHANGSFLSYGCKRVPILTGAREYLQYFDNAKCRSDASLEEVLHRFRFLDSKSAVCDHAKLDEPTHLAEQTP